MPPQFQSEVRIGTRPGESSPAEPIRSIRFRLGHSKIPANIGCYRGRYFHCATDSDDIIRSKIDGFFRSRLTAVYEMSLRREAERRGDAQRRF